MNDADHEEFVTMHVISKNLQSIRSDRRLEDLISEIGLCNFDLMCLQECWRVDAEECFETDRGDLIYLSGGDRYKGVGIVVSARFRKKIEQVTFHAYNSRVSVLKFSWGALKFECFSLYFPTSWDADAEVEGVYEILQLLLDNCRANGAVPILGGDFNASIGILLGGPGDEDDDVDLLGAWGLGCRNERGTWFVQWILSNGLRVASRQKHVDFADSWTCKRSSDGNFVQIDFILSDAKVFVESVWNDFVVPIGLDHRCVHCIMSIKKRATTHKRMNRCGMKNWKPIMDDQGRPSDFQHAISATMSTRTLSGFNDLEDVLLAAGRVGGACMKQKQRFRESRILQSLRSDRRMAQTVEERKQLTFMIQTKHKQELQTWKTSKINELLSRKNYWKLLPRMKTATHQRVAGHPPANEFADMLEQLFAGDPGGELQPPQLTETAWEKSDVYKAIKRMKMQKSADERGLVAELLKYAPDYFIAKLVDSFNDLMTTGDVPHEWHKTLFKMLPKNSRSKLPSDYRPIANIRLFYKFFAYMILGRIEAQLESTQPEEQHGFRSGRRVEEHLVTTQLVFDKLLRANVPIWIISLDLSKAFDRVHWPALWRALSQQGLSNHMIWILQNLYRNQEGQVFADDVCSRSFPIRGGVRQGCVLSPRLFNSVLEMAIACWRASVEDLGLDLGDGGQALLDFRFADDILIFGTSYQVVGTLLDKLVENLAAVGLQLNAEKTKNLTSQAQPPASLQTPNGLTISIVDQESGHKWLGCMLTTTLGKSTTWDVDHRLQAASRAFNANRWILCDSRIAISRRLE